MQLSAGVRVASFEVRGRLGAGGMGTVYRARDPKLRREVAIKVLQEKFEGNSEYLKRFAREARSASALNHPNIITVFEIGEFEGAPFIAMELVEGTRVRDLLRQGPFPLRKLLKIAAQVADGLAAAHDRGIVHRDIKPENLMVTKDGLVKILDFGLARPTDHRDIVTDDSTDELITHRLDGRVLGTAGYVSPEQASRDVMDFRSDQFSFGAVLYEMATGRRAFHRPSKAETLQAIIAEEPEPVQQLNPRIPEPLCWLITRCLAKDPHERYASTADLARELQTMRDRLPDTGPGKRAVPERQRQLRRTALVAAPLIAAAMVSFFIVRAHPLRKPPPPLPGHRYVAVLPFKDLSGRPDAQLFSSGLSDAVSTRLAKYPSIQVIPPASTAPLVAKGADARTIGQELGATLLLNAWVQRSGDTLSIKYALVDSSRGLTVADDTINGSMNSLWALQDQVSDTVARSLGVQENLPQSEGAQLENPNDQDMYLRALGNLQNPDDPKAIDSALELLHELLETAPNSPLVRAALGRAYLYKYNFTRERAFSDKAIQAADRAHALAPNAPDALFTLAEVQVFTGKFSEAIETYQRALALQPNSPEAVIGLGRAYAGAGQADAAERTFLRGIALRDTWWAGHNELGVLYLRHSRYDDAAREFSDAIKLNPHGAWGYSNLGLVYLNKGHITEAIAALKSALAIREDPIAYSNLGSCYYDLSEYDKSAAAFRKAIDLKPKLATYWANLADACRWTSQCKNQIDGAIAKAIELLNEDLAVNPNNPRAHGTLAVCLAKQGHRTEARKHMADALALDPKNGARMFQAARVANFCGDTAEAVKWLQRAHDAGFGDAEMQRDPEFEALRQSNAFRTAFKEPEARSSGRL